MKFTQKYVTEEGRKTRVDAWHVISVTVLPVLDLVHLRMATWLRSIAAETQCKVGYKERVINIEKCMKPMLNKKCVIYINELMPVDKSTLKPPSI